MSARLARNARGGSGRAVAWSAMAVFLAIVFISAGAVASGCGLLILATGFILGRGAR